MIKEGYKNYPICPCIFIRKSEFEFTIVTVYVDDMILIEAFEELLKTAEYLKREFEMKDFGKTKYCLSTPMVVRSLDPKKDISQPKKDDKEILGPKVSYLNAIGALLYVA